MFRFLSYSAVLCCFFLFSCSDKKESPKIPVFKIDVKANYFVNPSDRGWVILSDISGNVIGSKIIVANSTDSIPVPGTHKDGDVYSVTVLAGFYNSVILESYLSVEPTTIKLENKDHSISLTGYHTATINKTPSLIAFSGYGKNVLYTDGTYNESNETCTQQAQLYGDPADVSYFFAENTEDAPKYLRVPDAHPGGTITKDFSELTPMESKTAVQVGEADFSHYEFIGYGDNYDMGLTLYTIFKNGTNASALSIYHTDLSYLFDFQVNIVATKGNVSNTHSSVGTVPSTFKTVNGSLTSFSADNGTISFQSSGTYDVITAYAGTNGWDGTSTLYRWTVNMPTTLASGYKLPVIPDDIKSNEQRLKGYAFEFYMTELNEYSGITDYSQYVSKELELNESLYASSKEVLTKTTRLK